MIMYYVQYMCFVCCKIRLCTNRLNNFFCFSTSAIFTQRYHHIMAVRTLPVSYAVVFANYAVDLH